MSAITVHVCGVGCPKADDRKHVWDGPVVEIENGASVSCSLCGALAVDVSIMEGI